MEAAQLRKFLDEVRVSQDSPGPLTFGELERWDWFIIVGGKITAEGESAISWMDCPDEGAIWMKQEDGWAFQIAFMPEVADALGPMEARAERKLKVPADVQVIRILKRQPKG